MSLQSVIGRYLLVCVMMMMAWCVVAQRPLSNKPVAAAVEVPKGSLRPVSLPPAYGAGLPVSYVRTREAVAPLIEESLFDAAGYHEVKESTLYVDGLGRPLQSVSRQATPGDAPRDRITAMAYDAGGRESFHYLPYAAVSADGSFKRTPFGDQQAFYRGPAGVAGEEFFYARTDYEPSPLGRVTKTMAAGNNWVGSGRGVEQRYEVNTGADPVRLWQVDPLADEELPVSESVYAAGELFKNITTAEDGHPVIEYRDRQRQLVLKKVAVTEGRWLETYYVYDGLNRLRFVIPPKAVEAIRNDWLLTEELSAGLCFSYRYDDRGRLITKKIPGAGRVELVYDARDRLVFTRDENLRRGGRWMATLYDALNRPVSTGMISSDASAEALQEYQRRVIAEKETLLSSDGRQLAVSLNPLPEGAVYTPLTFTWHDDYRWTDKKYTDSYNDKLSATGDAYAQSLPGVSKQQHFSTRGQVTGTQARVLEDNTGLPAAWLTTVMFYDERARVIQTRSDNFRGGEDVQVNRYDFTGTLLGNYLVHHNPAASSGEIRVLTTLDHDPSGRLTAVWKTVNEEERTLVATYGYDALGLLQKKELGRRRQTGLPLETQDYSYNLRGWLKGINAPWSHPELQPQASQTTPWFGLELNYDWGSGTNLFNGNISSLTWRSKGDGVRRAYGFSYDGSGRLLGADYSQHSAGSFTDNGTTDFDMVMGDGDNPQTAYDAGGNILSMKQWGLKGSSSQLIDALQYSYHANSNKLRSVGESTLTQPDNHLGDFTDRNTAGDDYGYDANGNLVTDLNKGLQGATGEAVSSREGAIEYNHLNLPVHLALQKESANPKGVISYRYDASGNKLQKIVKQYADAAHNLSETQTVTTYLDGFVYEQVNGGTDELKYFAQEEGRVRVKTQTGQASYSYDYFLKDHLGNVRMVLTEEESTDFYPVASLEEATLDSEKRFYHIPDNGSRVQRSEVAGYPEGDGYTSPNDYVQRLNGNTSRVGTGTLLKVMSGDRVNIRASSWYRQNESGTGSNQTALRDIVSALLAGLPGAASGKWGNVLAGQETALSSSVAGFLEQQNSSQPPSDTRPKAYLNWLLLDEQLQPVITADGNNSGFDQVGQDQELKIHEVSAQQITTNGYLYIYLSNESTGTDLFFDNLQVTHIKGPLLEETHYYPFGLEMQGISARAFMPGYTENKKRYNGIEFTGDLGLDTYDAFFRNLDPQTGRWWQVDPKVDQGYEGISPYASMYDDPVKYSDLMGDEAEEGDPTVGSASLNFAKGIGQSLKSTLDGLGNAIAHPIQALDGIGLAIATTALHPLQTADVVGGTINNVYKNFLAGDVNVRASMSGQAVGEIAQIFVGVEAIKVGTCLIKGAKVAEIAKEIGILEDAVKGKGNFGLGNASSKTSNKLGKAWVGDEAKVASDGTTLVSKDGLKQYRPPTNKKSSFANTGVQSNFEWRNKPKGPWQGNGHLDIKPFWQF